MKSFVEFFSEAIVVKMKSRPTENTDAFIRDLHDTTEEHPFNHNARIYGTPGKHALIHVSPDAKGVHLHDIVSYDPGGGVGTSALQHLTRLADKHKIEISGVAKAYSNNPEHIRSTPKLKSWYTKHGFTSSRGNASDGYDITYKPK